MLELNQPAPAFQLQNDQGELVTLDMFSGKNLVIYFYPKDNTPGCTKESCGFSELIDTFRSHNTEVVGVSKDSVASHVKFKDKYQLALPLLSDPEGIMCAAYGAWGEKSMYGKKYMGLIRSTFLINAKGMLVQAWYKVRVKGHVESVLEVVKALGE